MSKSKLPAKLRNFVGQHSEQLTDTLGLINRSTLSKLPEALPKLMESKLLQPVYLSGGSLVVVLPEVRVEETRGGIHEKRLRIWLKRHLDQAKVESGVQGRLTLRPTDGTGDSALALANSLTEEVQPELAQARFIRIMPHPLVNTRLNSSPV